MEGPKRYGLELLRETFVVREATRKSMQGNRSADTRPELLLRRALWASGLRGYRKHYRKWPGKPDVAWVGRRLAVFVHGCYWHGCPLCHDGRIPATNRAFWQAKIERNQARHAAQTAELEGLGVRTLTLWECELRRDLSGCVEKVRGALA